MLKMWDLDKRGCELIFLIGFSVMLVFLIFASGVEAAEEELSLEAALDLLEEHSTSLQMAELEFANARVEYDKAQAEYIRTESRLQKLSADLSLNRSRQQYRNNLLGIYLDFMNDYQNLQIQVQEVEAAENEVEIDRARLSETEEQVQAGHEPRIELLRQQIQLNNAIFQLDEAEADRDKMVREMRRRLNLDQMPRLSSQLVGLEEMNIPERDEAVEMALDHNFSVEIAELSRELAEVELERAQISGRPELEILELENNLELAELEAIEVREDVEENVRDQIHRVEQTERQVELARDNLEQAEEHLRITREQREAGLVSARELDQAELEATRAELEKQEALTSHMVAYFQLQEMLGIDLEVIRDEIMAAFTR